MTTSRLKMAQGHYCPPGMEAQKCSAGTFNPLTGTQSVASCLTCLPGWACSTEGLTAPDEQCAEGHFCISGAQTATPEDEWSDGGGACTSGYFCPLGSISARPCPSGSYCSGEKKGAPEGSCSAGHYCSHHATEQQPTSKFHQEQCPSENKQGVCPPGAVCPAGAAFPFKCPPGWYHGQRQPQGTAV